MINKEKRQRIETLTLEVIKRMDNSKMLNYRRYKAMFESMNDEQFEKWAASMGHELDDAPSVYMLPFEEISMEQIKDAAKYLNLPLEEYVYFRHIDGKKIRTRMKCPVGFVPIKRMEQLLSKKNKYAIEAESRELKSGQVSGESKVASISDAETFFLSAINANEALKEFLSARADNMKAKQTMYKSIARNGYSSMLDFEDDFNESSVALNTVNTYMLASGIRSDLLTKDLKTPFTQKQDLKNIK